MSRPDPDSVRLTSIRELDLGGPPRGNCLQMIPGFPLRHLRLRGGGGLWEATQHGEGAEQDWNTGLLSPLPGALLSVSSGKGLLCPVTRAGKPEQSPWSQSPSLGATPSPGPESPPLTLQGEGCSLRLPMEAPASQ